MKMRFKVHSIQKFPASNTVVLYPVGCFEGVHEEVVTKETVIQELVEAVDGKPAVVKREVEVEKRTMVRSDTSNTDWCKDAPSGTINLSVDVDRDFFEMDGVYDFEVTRAK